MTTLAELIAQRDALEQQIKAQQNAARTDAIKQIQSLMADFGLTADDLGKTKGSKASKLEGAKVAAKYSHPTTR